MLRRWMIAGLIALAPLALSGCGGKEGFRFDVVPVDGQLLRGGKPVAGAFVRFHAADPSQVTVPAGEEGLTVMLTAETDEQGRFVMSTYEADDGVPAGDYAVTVSKPAVSGTGPAEGIEEGSVENSDGKRPPDVVDPSAIPAMYRDPATTPFKATVGTGENHVVLEMD